MAVIADSERPLVVAGVMGSIDAEVDEDTCDIVLEAAWFKPESVRLTSADLVFPQTVPTASNVVWIQKVSFVPVDARSTLSWKLQAALSRANLQSSGTPP